MPQTVISTTGRFQDRGCIECPDGYAYSKDEALGVLETTSKEILEAKMFSWTGPNFEIAQKATVVSKTLNPAASRTRKTVSWADTEAARFYDAKPNREQKTMTREMLQECGPQAFEGDFFDGGSIHCNPPRGPRPLVGKDRTYSDEVITYLEMGPYCISHFRGYEDFAETFQALAASVPGELKDRLTYEKIRRFTEMSTNNVVAKAGELEVARMTSGFFDGEPDSPGTLSWIIDYAETIASQYPSDEAVKVCCSPQLLEYWIRNWAAKNDISIETSLTSIQPDVSGYFSSYYDEKNQFMIHSKRTGRVIKFMTNYTPIYTQWKRTGARQYDWRFQPYWTFRPGDDTLDGEVNGIVRDPSTDYGRPYVRCPDGEVRPTSELILVYADSAFEYETGPSNRALTSLINGGQEMTDIQTLMAGSELRWFTGDSVQIHFLDHMKNPANGQCPSNLDNQWFAARASIGTVIREHNRRAMGAAMVRVPYDFEVNQGVDAIVNPCSAPLAEGRPAPTREVNLCKPEEPAPSAQSGCLKLEHSRIIHQSGSEDIEVSVLVSRVGGTDGEVSLDYAFIDDTAIAGTHYVPDNASGTLVLADGEDEACVNFIASPREIDESGTVPDILSFSINWSNVEGADFCDGTGGTHICLKAACVPADDCEVEAPDGCDSCGDATLVP